jgi:hypothetical protein
MAVAARPSRRRGSVGEDRMAILGILRARRPGAGRRRSRFNSGQMNAFVQPPGSPATNEREGNRVEIRGAIA